MENEEIKNNIKLYKTKLLDFYKLSSTPQYFDSKDIFLNTEILIKRFSSDDERKAIFITNKKYEDSIGQSAWARGNHSKEPIVLIKEFTKTPSVYALFKTLFKNNLEAEKALLRKFMPGVLHDIDKSVCENGIVNKEKVNNKISSIDYMREKAKRTTLAPMSSGTGSEKVNEKGLDLENQVMSVFGTSLLESYLKIIFNEEKYFQNTNDLKKIDEDIFKKYFLFLEKNNVEIGLKDFSALEVYFKTIFDFRHNIIHERLDNKENNNKIFSSHILLLFYFFPDFIYSHHSKKS